MTDAWYDELNDEQKSRAWRQRNSNGLGTGAPPPTRYVEETDVILPASELAAGATVTVQRHVHDWSVPEPMPTIIVTETTELSVFNVRDEGAVGDGVTDDTAAIQDVLTRAGEANGVVYVPPGTYSVTDMDVPAGVSVMGLGMGITTFKHRAGTSAWVFGSGAGASFLDFTIDGDYASGGAGFLYSELVAGADNTVSRIEIMNAASLGVHANGDRTRITDCRMMGVGSSTVGGTFGVYIPSAAHVVIDGCLLADWRLNGIFASANDLRVSNCTFLRNHHSTSPEAGGQIALTGDRTLIADCAFDGTGGGVAASGIEASGNGHRYVNNTITAQYYGIVLQLSSDTIVSGNVITNCGINFGSGSAIQVNAGISEFQIIGNRCYDTQGTKTQEWGLVIAAGASDAYVIMGNDFRNNVNAAGVSNGATGTSRQIVGNLPLAVNQLGLADGVSAPSAIVGQALIYVDSADGDLKARFGDGTVKTIVVDT